jgi:hypothetical protein
MFGVIRNGLREIGRKFKRVGLRRRIAAADRARDDKLVALGRRAWESKVAVPAADDVAQRIAGAVTQRAAVGERLSSLDQQRKEHEDKKQAETRRFDDMEKEVRGRKAPVDADLAGRRAAQSRAQGDLDTAKRRLDAIAASRRSLETPPPADRPASAQPPVDRAAVEAQLQALTRERVEIEGRLGPLAEAQAAAAAEVQKLEARSRELQAELDGVAAERRRVIGEIDQALAAVRRAVNQASAEETTIQKQQVAQFKELGTRLFASPVDDPALSDAMAAARAADQHRQELQRTLDGLVAESKAMPRLTMLKFGGIVVVLALVLIVGFGGPRPEPRLPEFSPPVQVPRDPVKTEVPSAGGGVQLPGVASVGIPANTLPADTTVTVAATASPETAEDFRETAVLYSPGPRLPYEVRVNTGTSAPIGAMRVELTVPESLPAGLPPNYEIRVFVQLLQDSGDEVHDGFRPIETFNYDGKSIAVDLPPKAFTKQRSREGTFEAVVVIGSSRVGPPRRSRAPSTSPTQAAIAQVPDLSWLRDRIRDLVSGPPPCTEVCKGWSQPVVPLTVNPNRPYNPSNDHYGTDYRATNGQAVFAVARGTIVRKGFNERTLAEENKLGLKTRGWGEYVVIEHCDGSRTLYAHLKKGSTEYLKVGHTVSAGEQIAEADNTGGSTGDHLHLEYSPSGKGGSSNTSDGHWCSYAR